MKIELREAGIALLAAALAGEIAGVAAGLTLSGLLGLGALGATGLALVGVALYRARPIRVGETVITMSGRWLGQRVRVDAIDGAGKAAATIMGYVPPFDRTGGLIRPRTVVVELPYASLRRLTAKERIRVWLFTP